MEFLYVGLMFTAISINIVNWNYQINKNKPILINGILTIWWVMSFFATVVPTHPPVSTTTLVIAHVTGILVSVIIAVMVWWRVSGHDWYISYRQKYDELRAAEQQARTKPEKATTSPHQKLPDNPGHDPLGFGTTNVDWSFDRFKTETKD